MSLASIERITEIKPIRGADKILAAKVLGYWTVIKWHEFSVGELVVFHYPDTILDENNPVYSFLKDKRLKVTKFRGQISQGLALPIVSFRCFDNLSLIEHQDVSDLIKIKKYEKPISFDQSKARGNFPSFLVKTDEENIRSCPQAIDEFKGKKCYFAQKVDGQSLTCYFKDGDFGVCSRNLNLLETDGNKFWIAARKFNIESILRSLTHNFAIQAELYGPGIQNNKCGESELGIRVFDIFDIDKQRYIDYEGIKLICKSYNLPMVNVFWEGLFDFTIEQLVETANSLEYAPGRLAEGFVIRPTIESDSLFLKRKRLSAKVISETFCLKYGE